MKKMVFVLKFIVFSYVFEFWHKRGKDGFENSIGGEWGEYKKTRRRNVICIPSFTH